MEPLQPIVLVEKLELYIFNPNHVQGWPRGRFLVSMGFDASDFEGVKEALILQASEGKTIATSTEYGTKWEIDGPITSPTNQTAQVRTVWFIGNPESPPTFVTFKPLRKTR